MVSLYSHLRSQKASLFTKPQQYVETTSPAGQASAHTLTPGAKPAATPPWCSAWTARCHPGAMRTSRAVEGTGRGVPGLRDATGDHASRGTRSDSFPAMSSATIPNMAAIRSKHEPDIRSRGPPRPHTGRKVRHGLTTGRRRLRSAYTASQPGSRKVTAAIDSIAAFPWDSHPRARRAGPRTS